VAGDRCLLARGVSPGIDAQLARGVRVRPGFDVCCRGGGVEAGDRCLGAWRGMLAIDAWVRAMGGGSRGSLPGVVGRREEA
jgi:hypothetical protein